jgi:chemotaxis methyl-accepting protein methylase
MLEFNRNLQVTTINYLEQALKPGGYIALGIKEHSLDDHMKNQFTIYNEKESIYKKKL